MTSELSPHYDTPEYHSDGLMMRVDLDRNRAVEWRTAADAYLTALRVAEQAWHDARFRQRPLFRSRVALLARASARYGEMVSAAEAAYAPVRTAASQLLDEAYSRHAAWQRKMDEADAMVTGRWSTVW